MAIKLEDFIPKGTNIFGARTPTYLEGLITPEQMKQAQQQSLFQGLLGTAVGYLAQPKNQGYGSAIPYLAKAYGQGMQMAQTPYSNLERDILIKEKFAELQRNQQERKRQEEYLKTFGLPNAERVTFTDTGMAATKQPVQGLEQGSIAPNYGLQPSTVQTTEQYYDPIKDLKAGVAAGVIKPETYINAIAKAEETQLAKEKLLREPPKVEEFIEGNQIVKKQWSPTLGWVEVSKGDRFAPKDVQLHSNTPTQLENGTTVLLPTAEGLQRGVKPITMDNKIYTGDVRLPKKALTESQGKNVSYSTRMEISDAQFNNLMNADGTLNYSPAAVNAREVISGWWAVGDPTAAVLNKYLLNENDKLAAQSQRDFINAVLRNESGAAIAASEFRNAQRQYFPEVGDTPSVLAQKAQNRKVAIAAMKSAAGQDPNAEAKLSELAAQIKGKSSKEPIQKAYIGSRAIIPNEQGTGWVYEDTGEPVEQ